MDKLHYPMLCKWCESIYIKSIVSVNRKCNVIMKIIKNLDFIYRINSNIISLKKCNGGMIHNG